MTIRILQGDCCEVLKTLPDQSVHCVVTSPPYCVPRADGGWHLTHVVEIERGAP